MKRKKKEAKSQNNKYITRLCVCFSTILQLLEEVVWHHDVNKKDVQESGTTVNPIAFDTKPLAGRCFRPLRLHPLGL